MARPQVAEHPAGDAGQLPPVDIVITNYNYGAYVCEAVDSALVQDHPSVHVIVVDDGSTDDSRARLEPYGDRIELLLQDNAGQPAAVNAGFARCRGEVVMFLDADDVLVPTTAGRVARELSIRPEAVRVQFRASLIDADGQRLARAGAFRRRAVPAGDVSAQELAFPFDLNWGSMSVNAFRTAALRRVMPVPAVEYGKWGADYYLVHLSTLLGQVIAMEEVGAFYRVHGENAFQQAHPVLDLDRIRREIGYQQTTLRALSALADELGLERSHPILSPSNIALRVISHRLAPDTHPVQGDAIAGLLSAAVRATARRSDLHVGERLALLIVIGTIAVSPLPVARKLAELLVYPELRPRLAARRQKLLASASTTTPSQPSGS